jgi:hypothetical protein
MMDNCLPIRRRAMEQPEGMAPMFRVGDNPRKDLLQAAFTRVV